MAKLTHIEWTQMTWNPVTGCTKVSQGCKHCYAEKMAVRLHAMGSPRYLHGFSITLHEDLIDLPRKWKKPRTVFVNSMSDLFHEDVPNWFIKKVFKTMNDCEQHTFQVLTKRIDRAVDLTNDLTWSNNIWMGTSIESQKVAWRSNSLSRIPAKVRFISAEPLIGPLDDLPLQGIHWVIVGGESGPKARPMEKQWVESVFRQCRKQKVAFFFKQWGGVQKHRTGRRLFGRIYDEMPTVSAQLA